MLVALTRERGRNEELRQWVGALADVVEIPLTATRYRPAGEVHDELRRSPHFGSFASLVVTSARAHRYLALAGEALVAGAEVFSVGRATTRTLEDAQFGVTRESPGTAADLAEFISRGPVLVLGAVGGRDELLAALTSRDVATTLMECYETHGVVVDSEAREQLRRADAVFIGAPSAWRSAREFVTEAAWVLVPGETTLAVVRAEHERVLRGWGEDFAPAWRVVAASSH